MTVHDVAPLAMFFTYLGSTIFAYPAYFALIAYIVVYAIYFIVNYVPDIFISILESLGDIVSGIGDICD